METTATKQGGDWVINGMKRFNTGMHTATVDLVFVRTSGVPGDARHLGLPDASHVAGLQGRVHVVDLQHAASDHAEVSLTNVKVPASSMLGEEVAPRRRPDLRAREPYQAGCVQPRRVAQYCIDMSVAWAPRTASRPGKALATNQDPVPARRAALPRPR